VRGSAINVLYRRQRMLLTYLSNMKHTTPHGQKTV
jgi:hypothetical protein